MTVAFQGTPTLVEQASGATITVPVPAAAAAGEVLIGVVATSDNAALGVPAGWTVIADVLDASGPMSCHGYWKAATGTEPASYTWTGITGTRASGIMARASGADTGTPLDAAATTVATGGVTSASLPSLTTVTPGALLISGMALNANSAAALVEPATMTEVQQSQGNGGKRLALAGEPAPTAGATGTRTWTENPTTTALQFAGWFTALRPTAAVAAFTGTAALAGGGALTGAGLPTPRTPATLTGGGTLAATGIPAPRTPAALTGTGALTTTAAGPQQAAATLSASGVLGGSGSSLQQPAPHVRVVERWDGADLTARVVQQWTGQALTGRTVEMWMPATPGVPAAYLAGAGLLTAAPTATTTKAAAPLTGVGALTTNRLGAATGAAPFTGAGALTAAPRTRFTATAALTGAGALTATTRAGTSGTTPAALTGDGALTTSTSVGGDPTPLGVPGSWALKFEDTFPGTSLDLTKWSNLDGWSMNGVTASAANVTVAGGVLSLARSDTVTGSYISTEYAWGYTFMPGDYAEARCYFPGDGTSIYNWPAWWTSGTAWPSNGEYDIAEVLGKQITANYHYGPEGTNSQKGPYTPAGYWGNAWHTYGVYRGTSTVDFYWDGVLIKSWSNVDAGGGHVLLLNNGASSAAGYGTANAFKVDYVRVWRSTAAGLGATPLGTAPLGA